MAHIEFSDRPSAPRLAASALSTFRRHRIETINELHHEKRMRPAL
jgi:hypothetical protein